VVYPKARIARERTVSGGRFSRRTAPSGSTADPLVALATASRMQLRRCGERPVAGTNDVERIIHGRLSIDGAASRVVTDPKA
jgi:hypothetical protein